MKKMAACFCLIGMLFSIMGGAMAAPGDATLYTQEQRRELGVDFWSYSNAMAVVGDTVYTLFQKEIFSWQVGGEAPVKVAGDLAPGYYSNYEEAQKQVKEKADTLITGLLSGGDVLYGLNSLTGKLFPITFQDGAVVYGDPIQLDWSDMEQTQDNYTYMKNIIRMVLQDGKLYAMIRNDMEYDKPEFVSFDLATGGKQAYSVAFAQDIAPYKEGKLLVRIYDRGNAYKDGASEPEKPTLAIFDPATGEAKNVGPFGNANVSGMVYQQETDTLFYATNSKLMAMKGLGTAAQAAYLPIDYAEECPAALLPGGLYTIMTWNGLFVRNTDPQYMPTSSLAVYGGSMDEAALAFSLRYPQVPLTFRDDLYFNGMEELAKAMASKDKSFDIYSVSVDYYDFVNLMQKGYCLDLGQSQELSDKISQMYPFLTRAVTLEGKLYGMPYRMYGYGLSTAPKLWEEAGIKDKIPTSFLGFLEFIAWWAQEGQEAHPDVKLMQGLEDYRETLFQLLMSQYVYECQNQGQELTFDTPLFRRLMQALEDIDTEALNDTLPKSDANSDMYWEEGQALFSQYSDWLNVYSGDYYEEYAQPLLLPMEEGGKVGIPAYVQVLFINPNTKDPEMAFNYLLATLEKMQDDQRVMMFPDENKGVPNPDYEKNLAQWQEELDKQKKLLETAKPEEVKDIQTIIDSYEEILKNKEQYYWNIDPESIAKYREIAQYCYTAAANPLSYRTKDGTSEINTLIERYRDKQISMDQFISEADKKLRMIRLERQ